MVFKMFHGRKLALQAFKCPKWLFLTFSWSPSTGHGLPVQRGKILTFQKKVVNFDMLVSGYNISMTKIIRRVKIAKQAILAVFLILS